MANDDSSIGLTLETDIPEKADEATQAMSGLKSVMEQISSQGEEMTEGFDALAKDITKQTEATEECKRVEEEALETEKSRIDIVGKLRDEIETLKKKHDDLNESLKLQTVNEEQYRAQSDLLVKNLKEKETILQRVTKEWDETTRREEEAARVLKQATLEEEQALLRVSEALVKEQEELNEVAATAKRAADSLETSIIQALEDVAGTGEGESGSGGFKGAASAALKAEKVMGGLASGSGFGRMGPMLESITSAIGLAGGTGLAAGGLIFAFESLGPKIAKFVEDMTGATEAIQKQHDALKAHQEQAAKTKEAVDKLIGGPTEEERKSTAAVKEMMEAPTGEKFRQAIFAALSEEGVGKLTEDEKLNLWDEKDEHGKRLHPESQEEFKMIGMQTAAMKERLRRLNEATDSIVAQMPTSAGVRERVSRMPQLPRELKDQLAETTPEGIKALDNELREAEEFGSRAHEAGVERRRRAHNYNVKHKRVVDAQKKEDAAIIREANELEAMEKAKRHRVEAAQRKEDAAIIREANEEDREQKHAETKAEQQRKHAEAKAKADAIHNTPEAINRRQQAEEKNEAMGLVQQNTFGFSPNQQAMIARHLQGNHQAGLDMSATFEQALAYAIQQTRIDIQRGIKDGMARQRVMSEGP